MRTGKQQDELLIIQRYRPDDRVLRPDIPSHNPIAIPTSILLNEFPGLLYFIERPVSTDLVKPSGGIVGQTAHFPRNQRSRKSVLYNILRRLQIDIIGESQQRRQHFSKLISVELFNLHLNNIHPSIHCSAIWGSLP